MSCPDTNQLLLDDLGEGNHLEEDPSGLVDDEDNIKILNTFRTVSYPVLKIRKGPRRAVAFSRMQDGYLLTMLVKG